jgi:hypothetical protein
MTLFLQLVERDSFSFSGVPRSRRLFVYYPSIFFFSVFFAGLFESVAAHLSEETEKRY